MTGAIEAAVTLGAAVTFGLTAAGSLYLIVSARAWWKRLDPPDWFHKGAVAICRGLLAAAAAIPLFAPEETAAAHVTLTARAGAILAWLLWEVGGAWADRRGGQTSAALRESVQRAKRAGSEMNALLLTLRHVTSKRSERCRDALRAGRTGILKSAREVLDPDEHLRVLFEAAVVFLQRADGAAGATFRMGLFVEIDGYLTPVAGFDSRSGTADPFHSPTLEPYRRHFRVGNVEDPAFVVEAIRHGGLGMVADCDAPGTFRHYRTEQAEYLKSIAVFSLRNFSGTGSESTRAGLVVDTDHAGFFRDDRAADVERLMRQLEIEVDHEYLLKQVLAPTGGTS